MIELLLILWRPQMGKIIDWVTLIVNEYGEEVRFEIAESDVRFDPLSKETSAFHLHWGQLGQIKMTTALVGTTRRHIVLHCPHCGLRAHMSEGSKTPRELWQEFETLNPHLPRLLEHIG
ncbi:MAG: hypothetical protein HYW91_02615 [Candidatus Sungbacteria bacterium]|nr:hypothetical protein [Candidatus Sungbacteria bacterium]